MTRGLPVTVGLMVCLALAASAGAQAFWIGPNPPGTGGDGNWNVASHWTTGVVPNSPSVNVHIDSLAAASQVTLEISPSVNDLTIDAGDTLLANGAALSIYGDLTVNGTLTLASNASLSGQDTGTQSFGGAGTVNLVGGASLSAGGSTNLQSALSFNVESGDSLYMYGGGRLTSTGAQAVATDGTLYLDSLNNAGGSVAMTGGQLQLINMKTAELGAIANTGGTVKLIGTLNNAGSTLALTATTGSFDLSGTTINGGTYTSAGGARLRVTDGASATFSGVTLDGDVFAQNATTSFTNHTVLNGTYTLDASALLVSSPDANPAAITGTGTVRNVNVTSFGNDPLRVGSGITLAGTGTMVGYVTLAGTLAPGDSVGTLTWVGTLTSDDATFDFELGAPGVNDLLRLSGSTLALAGLNDKLTLTGGTLGETYHLIDSSSGGTITGLFENVTPGYVVTYLTDGVHVTVVPEPASIGLLILMAVCTARRRAA